MLGLRGMPNIQGGIETHVEHLSQELVKLGCEVEVLARSPYVKPGVAKYSEWRGIKITRVWSPRSSHFETVVHTFLGVLIAARRRPDLLHIHAIGPGLMVPLARLFGLRVIVTHHGFDYRREKWNRIAKLILRLGEFCGMRFANMSIAVSAAIAKSVETRFARPCRTIHNGVAKREAVTTAHVVERFNLRPAHYVLNVSRMVPEKCHLDLIEAFSRANLADWKLVLVGGADHKSDYVEKVRKTARETANVIMTGPLSGNALAEIYANAGVFVLPSSHEGLPIVLLEALSYGLTSLASDIPANCEVGMPADCYFPLHNVDLLGERLRELAGWPKSVEERTAMMESIARRFAWPEIGRQTFDVYLECMSKDARTSARRQEQETAR
jgi:glycosyltransferase involved in cell wall biosynthesis